MNLIQKIQSEINREVEAWLRALIAIFKANIAKNDIIATQELQNSFQTFINQNLSDFTTNITINFAEQGRLTDMKTWNFSSKMPPVQTKSGEGVLLDWVKNKGIETDDKKAKQIAWGIAKSIQQKGIIKRKKRQRWNYAKVFYSEVQDLRDKINIIMSKYTQEEVQRELEKILGILE